MITYVCVCNNRFKLNLDSNIIFPNKFQLKYYFESVTN